jgi:hypothetical protein
MSMTTFDLLSPLARPECERRLRDIVKSEWLPASNSGVVGKIDGDAFRLRKMIYYRNSFQRSLYGQMSDAPGGGTRLLCEAREMDLKWVFILAGVIVGVAFLVVLWSFFHHKIDIHDVPLVAILAPAAGVPLLVGIGTGAVFFGRWAARNDQQFLLDFLRQILDAH